MVHLNRSNKDSIFSYLPMKTYAESYAENDITRILLTKTQSYSSDSLLNYYDTGIYCSNSS